MKIIALLLIPCLTLAQAQGINRYYYKMTINDSVAKNYSEMFMLNISSSATEFKNIEYLTSMVSDITVNKNEGRFVISGNANTLPKNFIRGRIYRDMHSNLFKTVETLVIDYVIADSIQNAQWKILADTANIEGLSCQKARGFVYGRNSTVFFAKDIPLPYGPWKLGGLPGLIVSAQDDEMEFGFRIVSPDKEIVKKNNANIELPAGVKFRQINKYDYLRYSRMFQENSELYSKMVTGGEVQFKSRDDQSLNIPTQQISKRVIVPLFCRIEHLK